MSGGDPKEQKPVPRPPDGERPAGGGEIEWSRISQPPGSRTPGQPVPGASDADAEAGKVGEQIGIQGDPPGKVPTATKD